VTTKPTQAGGAAVAIVGIGCRFPGGIGSAADFWRCLLEERDAITEIPRDRFDLERYFNAAPATPGRVMTRWGGFLERLQEFDPFFFGISPREAERLDPQQRLVLETAWEALEDAGQDIAALEGSGTGVFIGQWLSDFESRLFADPETIDFYMTTGSGRYATSGRLSYLLGLRGPSLTLDTACSSSLVAVHTAIRSLRSGESTLALAGGVNTILQPHITVAYSQSRMMAPDGRCKFGDAAGDGYVRSEGAGLVVLKLLDQAVRDGDRIYAVIRGSAVNNDGRSSGSMGTPSRLGQEELLRTAYSDAQVSPGAVGYIEAHGTGTRAGDPVELGALSAVLSEGRAPGRRAYVGSVKTNFGHTEGAAGIAGLIKAALCLHHRRIPASLHCKQLNPAIPWEQMPIEVSRSQHEWTSDGPRFAGVSAFGIAGTNAHVVLESADPAAHVRHPEPGDERDDARGRPILLPLSARSPEGLRAVAGGLHAWLVANPDVPLDDVVWNAATRRTALEHRVAFVAPSRATLIEALAAYATGGPATAQGVWHSQATPKVAFVVPGQGAQWTGMARELAAREPVFRETLERCDRAARAYCDYSIVEQLHLAPGVPGYRLDSIDAIQPVLVAMAIAYAQWLASLGIEAGGLVGHSMGEVGAAHLAGVLDLDQAMRIICRRSALMRTTSGQGAMAMVELSMADAEARLVGRESRVSVAASNSPRSSVISGEPTAVQEIIAECERDGIFCRFVKVDVASHSPQMEKPAATLRAELAQDFAPRAARVPLYSTVLARETEGTELDAAYWASNMRQPVRFTAAVSTMLEAQTNVFVELGPHPVLMPAVQQTADSVGSKNVVTVACGRRDEDEHTTVFALLANLWAAGVRLDWKRLLPRGGNHVSLPSYPWQRERHWVDAAEPVVPGRGSARAQRLDEETLGWLHRLEWSSSELPPRPAQATAAGGRWLVVSHDGAAGTAIAAEASLAGVEATVLVAGGTQRPVAAAIGAALAAGDFERVIVFVAQSDDAPYLPIEVFQAVSRASDKARSPPRLWFLTTAAQFVGSDPQAAVSHRVSVMQAALWGTCRVIAEEHPELWGGLVDLDPDTSVTADAALLAGVLLATDEEDQVAVRDGKRFCLRLQRFAPKGMPAPPIWRSDAAYLITGGLGDIGLRIARTLIDQGARRLILLGRTPLPPRERWAAADPHTAEGARIAAIRALESAGASVLTAAVDVADEGQVASFLARYRDEAWPPIRGVVHAAGSFANQLAGAMDRRAFEAVVAPKLRGAQILDRLLPEIDFLVLFSSTGAFVAQPGQANYAAANAGLDAVALDRRARGRPALSIAWGVWRDTGLVKGATAERNVAEMTRQGMRPFAPERGTALFTWLCGRGEPTLVVLPVDWAAFRSARGGRDAPLYREVIGAAGNAAATPEVDFTERLTAAGAKERRQILEGVVRETVGKVLSLAPARIDSRRVLGSMGMGSLGAMELRNRLEALLRRPLSATLAWNYPTVEALSAYLAGDASAEKQNAPPSVAAVELTEVAALSDEDALLALRGSRAKGRR
jgi:phthiocerol/phenolphthiocerol synthesis type-I polyketide synthase B